MRIVHFFWGLLVAVIACSENTEPAPGPGAVTIAASTTGGDEDGDGYTVVLDGQRQLFLPPDGAITFDGLVPGSHDIALEGVAPNCDASPENLQSVRVLPGDTTRVRYFVTCYHSGVTIETHIEGVDAGPFYTIVLDGVVRPELVTTGGIKTITGLSPGIHEIRLENVPANCSLTPSTQRPNVTLRQVIPVAFNVSCTATHGALRVEVQGTGRDLDLDGVEVSANNMRLMLVPTNGALVYGTLAPGVFVLRLSDVAVNCEVEGGNGRTVTITAGKLARDTVRVLFQITCRRHWGLAFMRDGQLALATADGSQVESGPEGFRPAWSPDGTRLAYSCYGLCVIELDSGRHFGTTSTWTLEGPAWSPDGSRIAYTARECDYTYYYGEYCEFRGLYFADASATNGVKVSLPERVLGASDPAWAPNGKVIAMGCTLSEGWGPHICVVGQDGLAFRDITSTGGDDSQPSWSPDGSRLVFATTRFGGRQLATVKSDGSDIRRFDPVVAGWSPVWLRDGRIMFASSAGGLAIMNADGTGLVRLTTTPGDSLPSLRP